VLVFTLLSSVIEMGHRSRHEFNWKGKQIRKRQQRYISAAPSPKAVQMAWNYVDGLVPVDDAVPPGSWWLQAGFESCEWSCGRVLPEAKRKTFLISALMLMNGDGQEQVATAAEAGQTRQQATDVSPTPMATHPTTHPQEHPSKWMGTRKLLRWVAKCQLSGGKSRPLGMGLRVGMAPRTGQWICRMGKTICPGGLAVTCRRNFSLRRALEKRSHLKSMISHILQNRISIFFEFPIFIFLSEASILIKMNQQTCY